MTDPRSVLRPAGPDPELDLPTVRARARQLGRRRRLAAATGVGALVSVAVLGGLVLHHDTEEVLRPPIASASPSSTPSPSTAPSLLPPMSPSPSGLPTSGAPVSRPPTSLPTLRPSVPGLPSPIGSRPPTGAPGSGRPSRGTTTPPAPTTPPTPTPAFVADSSPEEQAATGQQLSLVAVRAARQDGYDRVVYELSGPAGAVPGWRVEYVDSAVLDPSGQPVAVRGSAVLQVVLTSLEPGASGSRQVPSGTRLLREVVPGTVFEGIGQSFLGLDTKAPFRVFALTSPARVVVDVLAP